MGCGFGQGNKDQRTKEDLLMDRDALVLKKNRYIFNRLRFKVSLSSLRVIKEDPAEHDFSSFISTDSNK